MSRVEKEYNEKLPNGTAIDVKISVEVGNYNEEDYREAFSRFSHCSMNFYLEELVKTLSSAETVPYIPNETVSVITLKADTTHSEEAFERIHQKIIEVKDEVKALLAETEIKAQELRRLLKK